jgi:predicted esterase
VYVELHGLWDVASEAFRYMSYPYTNSATYNIAFEDGFHLSPWGRGNLWYQGNSKKDIWECIAALDEIAETDSSRKYLCGHSMGGYGAMSIAGNSPDTWAAVGIYAGALLYNPSALSPAVINALKDVPVYFVCGTQDHLFSINEEAYSLLEEAGNENIYFTSFNGGHIYRQGDVDAMYMWMRNFVNDNFTAVENHPKIYDLSGRMIYSVPALTAYDNGQYCVNTSELVPGTYIFQLSQGIHQISGIFIKQ